MRKQFEHVEVDLGYDDLETTQHEGYREYHHPSGSKFYTSVTTVLSILSKDSIDKWRKRVGDEEADKISFRASQRGTAVHELVEKYLDNDSDYLSGFMPNVVDSFLTIKDVLDKRIGRIYGQECPLFSDHLGLAGRVDCVAEFDGRISIIDFKTSRKLKQRKWITNYFQQETAYAIMWEERTGMPVEQLVTIVAVDDTVDGAPGNQVFVEERDNWTDKLKETIQLYHDKQDEPESLFG